MKRIEFTSGPFKSLQISEHWLRTDQNMDPWSWLIKFAPAGDPPNIFLAIYDRGIPISGSAANSLAKLLADTTKDARKLNSREISELSQVMGITSIGDNQFTNSYQYPDPKSPAFALEYAGIINIKERLVLEVQGEFLSQQGSPINFFRGIFIQSKFNPTKIQEFFLQSDSEKKFTEILSIYQNSVQSIEW